MTVAVSIQSWISFILRIKNEIVYWITRCYSSAISGSGCKHVTWMFPWPIGSGISKRLICFRTSLVEGLVTWIMPQAWTVKLATTTNIHVRSSIYLLRIFWMWITLGMPNHLLESVPVVLVVLIWIRRTILSHLTRIVFFTWAEIVRNQRYIMHCCG